VISELLVAFGLAIAFYALYELVFSLFDKEGR